MNSTNSTVGGEQEPWQVLHLEVMHAPKLDEKVRDAERDTQYSNTFKDVMNGKSKRLGAKIDRTGSRESTESGESHVRFKVGKEKILKSHYIVIFV